MRAVRGYLKRARCSSLVSGGKGSPWMKIFRKESSTKSERQVRTLCFSIVSIHLDSPKCHNHPNLSELSLI